MSRCPKAVALAGAAVTLTLSLAAAAPAQTRVLDTGQSGQQNLVQRYCSACHNEALHRGDLVLDNLDLEQVGSAAESWEKVVRKLRTGAMPPAGRPRPDGAAVDRFVSFLETELDAAAASEPNPGRLTLHRLNRTEYGNAIRDLLALDVDSSAFLPPDDEDQGFDTIANALTISPTLMNRYLRAARNISQLAIGDPELGPVIEDYPVARLLTQDGRINEDQPFGSRGGTTIRHYFPLDGEYTFQIRLRRNVYGYLRGFGRAQNLDVRIDKQLLKRFTVGGEDWGTDPPAGWAGWPPYMGNSLWEKWMLAGDNGLQLRLEVKAGMRVVSVAFAANSGEPENVLQPAPTDIGYQFDDERLANASVESVQIAGPYAAGSASDTPSRRRVFTCYPTSGNPAAESECAREIVAKLARRAYRRPVTERDIGTLLEFFEHDRQAGGFDRGIQNAIERLLIDPQFLLRIEHDPVDSISVAAYRLTDLELASRLSFFLWSSIPDDELLAVAERGELKDPSVLEGQVRRMLADRRSTALVDHFFAQWLLVGNISSTTVDADVFPYFDDNLRQAFEEETRLFLQSQLAEDRPLHELLTADYTFLNDRLAKHYGVPNVYGSHFRRVAMTDESRRGILGQGSVLTVTSYANRTSPVLRGKWLLMNILGTPPPPPPPDIPALKATGEGGRPASVRERLSAHRSNPVCASCHAQIDPLGFPLENFDAIGGWRETDTGTVIDASGALPDGTIFDGPSGLRTVLRSDRYSYAFARTAIEKLMTYGLGRAVEYTDMPSIRQILQASQARDHRWSSIILGVVTSEPFQMRRTAP